MTCFGRSLTIFKGELFLTYLFFIYLTVVCLLLFISVCVFISVVCLNSITMLEFLISWNICLTLRTMFNSSVGGRFIEKKKKIEKKIIYLFLFSTVTIYRLDHTYSLGSVEPTIALSKSLWSRIVT